MTPRKNNWDEFRWELEIRRDERRISNFFSKLPGCLDLPGKEEMLVREIMNVPVLEPSNAAGESFQAWSYMDYCRSANDGEAEDENLHDTSGEANGVRSGENLIDALDELATEWNCRCALIPEEELQSFPVALTLTCAYAKLLARTADFLDIPDKDTALKRCLGKRAVSDLLNTVRLLDEAAVRQGMQEFAAEQQERLLGIRGHIIDRFNRCAE